MRLVLIQTAFLGDLVLSTPVVDALGMLFPEATLDLVTTEAGESLFRNDPRFRTVRAFQKRGSALGVTKLRETASILRKEQYDRAYSLHRSFRTALLLACTSIPTRIGFRDAYGSFLYTERRVRQDGGHAAARLASLLLPEWRARGWTE